MTAPIITALETEVAAIAAMIAPLNRALSEAQTELEAVSELDPVADALDIANALERVSRCFIGRGDFSRLSSEINRLYSSASGNASGLRQNHADREKRQQVKEAAERAQAEAAEAARLAQIASERAEVERMAALFEKNGFIVSRVG